MTESRKFAATILRASAGAYGNAVSSLLMERNPDVRQHFGTGSWSSWSSHLAQRVLELAAAVDSDSPQLFVDRLQWTRKAFAARGVPEADLLASLECLREVLDADAPPAVRDAVTPALAAAIQALEAPLPADAPGLSADTDEGRLALSYLLSALEGDGRRAMDSILQAVAAGRSVEDVLVNVLMPVQVELGQMWHSGELGIAQEHYVTAITQRLMAVLAHRQETAPATGRAVLLAAVSGDTHGVAIQALAYLFELAGWRAVNLGPDVPGTDIAAAADYFDVDLILLSATLPTNLSAVESAITVLRESGDRRPVIVGGLAYAGAPLLWKSQGADGYGATAAATLELAGSLTSER